MFFYRCACQPDQASGPAGKAVFCEKPVSLDWRQTKEAIAAAEDAGVILQIGFNRRFDPNFRTVREWVKEGKIGDVHMIKITSRDPSPPPPAYIRASGGLFLDMAIHDFDMARYLSGSDITEVHATGGVLADPQIGEAGDIDTALVTMKFACGAFGVIDNSRKAVYGYDQRGRGVRLRRLRGGGQRTTQAMCIYGRTRRASGKTFELLSGKISGIIRAGTAGFYGGGKGRRRCTGDGKRRIAG